MINYLPYMHIIETVVACRMANSLRESDFNLHYKEIVEQMILDYLGAGING